MGKSLGARFLWPTVYLVLSLVNKGSHEESIAVARPDQTPVLSSSDRSNQKTLQLQRVSCTYSQ